MLALIVETALHRDGELLDLVREAGATVRCIPLAALLSEPPKRAEKAVVLLGVGAATDARVAHRVRRIRGSGVRTPVLLIAFRDAADEIGDALEAGATDFVRRASARVELRVRLRALARRVTASPKPHRIRLGRVEIDQSTHVMRCGDRAVSLTNREYRLLECLASHPGQLVPRKLLEQWVWGRVAKPPSRSNIVDVYIAYVRRKLSTLGVAKAVRTHRGIGYTIAADLRPTARR
jgi:DNA-binding response OmpR family regulator